VVRTCVATAIPWEVASSVSVDVAPGVATTPRPPLAQRRRLLGPRGPGWPLVVLLGGFPLWWITGMSQLLVFVMAAVMAMRLVRRRTVVVPPGFGWWMIFLGVVLIGIPLLFVDVPGTIAGGGASRLPVFFYRLAWYLSCTVILLWIGNLDEKELPSLRVVRLFGWLFVVTVLGGLLGVFVPRFEVTSLMELLLPGPIATNDFVKSIIHPSAAEIQNVLGPDLARPNAPFAYANAWGSNLVLTLPFFIAGWLRYGNRSTRAVAPIVLVLAAIPVVFSLNRGLWACLALGAVLLALRLALNGRVAPLVAMGVVLVLGFGGVAVSPLGDMIVTRVNNPHSNDRRGQLLTETVNRTMALSPVAGFGSTRRVQGNFESIAGGSRPDCDACGVPPLGTQGHIWLLIFSQGLVGLVAFVAFFATRLRRHWRSRTTLEAIGVSLIAFYSFQLFIYDSVGFPLFTIMAGVALMWRERWRAGPGGVPDVLDTTPAQPAAAGRRRSRR
jgi:hypothetical protein